jgi:hypothetical protein
MTAQEFLKAVRDGLEAGDRQAEDVLHHVAHDLNPTELATIAGRIMVAIAITQKPDWYDAKQRCLRDLEDALWCGRLITLSDPFSDSENAFPNEAGMSKVFSALFNI